MCGLYSKLFLVPAGVSLVPKHLLFSFSRTRDPREAAGLPMTQLTHDGDMGKREREQVSSQCRAVRSVLSVRCGEERKGNPDQYL